MLSWIGMISGSYPVGLVVLPDPFRGMGAWRNSTETQQSGYAPRSGPEVKNGKSRAWFGRSRSQNSCKQVKVMNST